MSVWYEEVIDELYSTLHPSLCAAKIESMCDGLANKYLCTLRKKYAKQSPGDDIGQLKKCSERDAQNEYYVLMFARYDIAYFYSPNCYEFVAAPYSKMMILE